MGYDITSECPICDSQVEGMGGCCTEKNRENICWECSGEILLNLSVLYAGIHISSSADCFICSKVNTPCVVFQKVCRDHEGGRRKTNADTTNPDGNVSDPVSDPDND